jgi:hypothetical protein
MTEKEIVEKLLAGETVTLYYPMRGVLDVGKRILKPHPNNPEKFYVHYGDDAGSLVVPFALKGNLLRIIVHDREAEPNWWLAWARSLRLQKGDQSSLTYP